MALKQKSLLENHGHHHFMHLEKKKKYRAIVAGLSRHIALPAVYIHVILFMARLLRFLQYLFAPSRILKLDAMRIGPTLQAPRFQFLFVASRTIIVMLWRSLAMGHGAENWPQFKWASVSRKLETIYRRVLVVGRL